MTFHEQTRGTDEDDADDDEQSEDAKVEPKPGEFRSQKSMYLGDLGVQLRLVLHSFTAVRGTSMDFLNHSYDGYGVAKTRWFLSTNTSL